MRWLTRSVRLRVAVAAIIGLAAGELVLAWLNPPDTRLVTAAIVAAIVTLVAAVLAARSVTVPLDRELESSGQRRRAEENERRTVEADRDRLAALVDELGEAILIADEGGHVERANRAATSLFGGDLVGHPLADLVRDHELLDAIRSARADADTVVTVERADPPRFQRAIARRLKDHRLLLVVQELTAMRRLETVRRDFVANVSHELRTPIASISAMVEALETGALDDRETARDFVRRMRHEVNGLAGLVEDLLILGRVESGQERFALIATPPADLLQDAADRMRPLTARAGVRLVVDDARQLPDVAADRDRLAQVFANLLHNAARHTPPGGEIRLSAAAAPPSVVFHVHDTGDGIAVDDLDRIFERFYKGDRSRATGGTGLGLSIAKHIVEAHGGSIRAESEGPGRGATFTFTLPIAAR